MALRYFKAIVTPHPSLPAIGSATWAELHTYRPFGDARDNPFIEDFSGRVSGIGCACHSHWRAWLKANPVRWDDYFAWTVEAHNAVNARLGKRQLTVREARAEQTRHSFNLPSFYCSLS